MYEIKDDLADKFQAEFAELVKANLPAEDLAVRAGRLLSAYNAVQDQHLADSTVQAVIADIKAQLPTRLQEMLSSNSTTFAIEFDSALPDIVCGTIRRKLQFDIGTDCAVFASTLEHEPEQTRKLTFRFVSKLPQIEPRHLEAVQAMQPNPTQIVGEDKRFHVATIDEGSANLNWQYPPKLAPVDSRHMDAAQALASSEKARAKLVTTDGTFTIQVHNPEAPNEV